MKKLVLIFVVFFVSCGETSKKIKPESSFMRDSLSSADSARMDSIARKITDLLLNTSGAEHKVKEIKDIKKENVSLKKELVEIKAELQEVKAVLSDTTEHVKKKKSFIQKVISTIKKDTAQ